MKGQGGEISLPQISKILKKAKLPIVVSYADIDGLEEIIEDSNIKDMVREVVMVLGESDGQLVMSLQVIAQSVETAESLHDMVNGLMLLMDSNYTNPINLGNPQEFTGDPLEF